jgi:NAD(P)-dependent dehydrogenase (short-subunit alcohol dehydrogenase family)
MTKRILITGGSSGVGKSLVEHLSGEFEVITFARRLHQLEAHFSNNEHVHYFEQDLSNLQNLEAVIQRIGAEHGPISYLINNAAVNESSSLENLDSDNLRQSFFINTIAPILIIRTLIDNMRRRNFGRIINITSGAAIDCPTDSIPYNSSKAALNAATITMAKEMQKSNIKINLMSPGPVQSEMAPKAPLSPEVCHPTVDYLLSLDADGPTGRLFWLGREVPLHPDLHGLDWASGVANDRFDRIPSNEQ